MILFNVTTEVKIRDVVSLDQYDKKIDEAIAMLEKKANRSVDREDIKVFVEGSTLHLEYDVEA